MSELENISLEIENLLQANANQSELLSIEDTIEFSNFLASQFNFRLSDLRNLLTLF